MIWSSSRSVSGRGGLTVHRKTPCSVRSLWRTLTCETFSAIDVGHGGPALLQQQTAKLGDLAGLRSGEKTCMLWGRIRARESNGPTRSHPAASGTGESWVGPASAGVETTDLTEASEQ